MRRTDHPIRHSTPVHDSPRGRRQIEPTSCAQGSISLTESWRGRRAEFAVVAHGVTLSGGLGVAGDLGV